MPQHKSAKKRIQTAEKARVRNKMARSAIKTSLKKIREAKKKADVLTEMPVLFSMMDKAAAKNRAGFTKNRVGNYKRKVHKLLSALET